eukprot:TRINITY_DN2379_c0_g1_i2.p1 TRINITY_DN2379_c0_g1~~TRINITY_DN2379_c0_g1_i2.p1  ORF type:complete len:100 (-),score=13.35 TRINITY_DN2379_c0_g1_i2:14-313(-)
MLREAGSCIRSAIRCGLGLIVVGIFVGVKIGLNIRIQLSFAVAIDTQRIRIVANIESRIVVLLQHIVRSVLKAFVVVQRVAVRHSDLCFLLFGNLDQAN